MRSYDSRLFICLHQFIIEDRQQNIEEFKYLAKSNINDKDNEIENYIIQACLIKISPNSPEFNNIEQSLTIYFNPLSLVCNQETVSILINFSTTVSNLLK